MLTDTLALVVLAVVIQNVGDERNLLQKLGPLLWLLVVVVVSLWLVPRASRRMLEVKVSPAEQALYVLGVPLGLAVLTRLIGTEDILGAFLAGLCLNRVLEHRDVLREHVTFVGNMLFIPFFFVSTGMLLEIQVVAGQREIWWLAGLLVGLVLAGKGLAAWITGRLFGFGWWDRAVMFGLTMPQAAATLAVTVTGRKAQLLSEDVVDAVIILIFVTCLAGPILTRLAGRRLAQERAAEWRYPPPETNEDGDP